MSEEMAMVVYVLLHLRRKKKKTIWCIFFSLLSLQTKIMKKIMKVIKSKFRLRGKTHFVSVSIFKDKTTMLILLQQLDLCSNKVAAPKLQQSWRLTCHSLCSSVRPGTK